VHARHAQVLAMGVGEGAASHQRRDDRRAREFGELAQRRRGAGLEHAAAHVQDRAPRHRHEPGGLADLLAVRLHGRAVPGKLHCGRPREFGPRLEHVLGDVDQDRTGPAGRGEVERFGHDARHVVDRLHQVVVLGDRQGDAVDVGLLERVRADGATRHLTGDGDHGDRVHVRVGDRRDQIGRPGAGGGDADAYLAGGLGVPGRGVPGALLVPDQYVADLGVEDRVVRGQDRTARDTEHDVDTERLEGSDERLRAGDRLADNGLGRSGGGRCGRRGRGGMCVGPDAGRDGERRGRSGRGRPRSLGRGVGG
jgi:hypothetical protein